MARLVGVFLGVLVLLFFWRFWHGESKPYRGRVAVCVSGQLRHESRAALASLAQHIVAPLDADVFLALDECAEAERLQCEHMLRPRAAVYERRTSSAQGIPPNVDVMWQRIAACDWLRQRAEAKQGQRYDVVLRVRPDLFYSGPLPDYWLHRAARDQNEIIVPLTIDAVVCGVNDQFALAGPSSAARLALLWEHWAVLEPPADRVLEAEELLERWCRASGLFPALAVLPLQFYKFNLDSLLNGGIATQWRKHISVDKARGQRKYGNWTRLRNSLLLGKRLLWGNSLSESKLWEYAPKTAMQGAQGALASSLPL